MTAVSHHTLWDVWWDANPGSGTPNLMNASGESVALTFEANVTGTITKVSFKLGTVTTGDDLKISIQGIVATTGLPDGVINGSASVETIADTDDNIWVETATTGLAASVTRGGRFCVVIEFNSFVAGNLEIDSWGNTPRTLFPYILHDSGAGFVKDDRAPLLGLNYGGTFHERSDLPWPILSVDWGTSTWDNADNPDERGLKFKTAVESKLTAVRFLIRASVGDNIEVKLYSDGSPGTLLETIIIDKDLYSATNITEQMTVYFTSDHTLAADAFFRITLEPISTSATMRSGFFITNSSAEMGQLPGGTDIIWTERNNAASTWTDDSSKRALIYPIITDIAAGGGGGSKLAGRGGGLAG